MCATLMPAYMCPALEEILRQAELVRVGGQEDSVTLHLTWYFIIQRSKPKTTSVHTLFFRAYSFRHTRSSP